LSERYAHAPFAFQAVDAIGNLFSYRLTLDTICIKKSHQIIVGTMVVAIRRSAAAVAARPALVK
jgi:hypothetical protein